MTEGLLRRRPLHPSPSVGPNVTSVFVLKLRMMSFFLFFFYCTIVEQIVVSQLGIGGIGEESPAHDLSWGFVEKMSE